MKAKFRIIKRTKYVGLEAINFVIKPLQTSLVSLLVIRLFNVDLWGDFVIFLVSIELFNTIINWGQKPFLLREFSLKPNEINKLWSKTVYARIPLLLISLLIMALTPLFKWYSFIMPIYKALKKPAPNISVPKVPNKCIGRLPKRSK